MRPLPDRQPPFLRPTWHRQRLCALHFPQGIRSSNTTHRLFFEVLQVRIKATMARKRLRQVKADLTVISIQPGGELWDQTMCPSPRWSSYHLVYHFSTSLCLQSLRMAYFARAIPCRFVKQVSSLRS